MNDCNNLIVSLGKQSFNFVRVANIEVNQPPGFVFTINPNPNRNHAMSDCYIQTT